MTALYIISFILLVVATIALLKLTPEQINKDINELFNKQQTLKDQALMARGKKRKNRLILELERIRRALQETGKEKQFSLACTAALLLMVVGCIVAIAIDNPGWNSVIPMNDGGGSDDPQKKIKYPSRYAADLYINNQKVAELDLLMQKGEAE